MERDPKDGWHDNGQPCPRTPADGEWKEEKEEWYDNGQPFPYTPADGQW